ncbi:MAG: hypothetical protein IPG50_25945 [Myxococcales bacterium]|nr:hypothetical protein [Myxococcales bacterium]
MTQDRRIVVTFRMPSQGVRAGEPSSYLVRSRSLASRAEALGATLCSWSAMTVAFAFPVDALEEAIDLVVSLITEVSPEGERWAAGVAEGSMETLDDKRNELAWGEPLVVSLTLSRVARSGEALVHTGLSAIDALRLMEVRAATDGGLEVRGSRLDPQRPWRRRPHSGAAVEPSPPPPPAKLAAVPGAVKAPNLASGAAAALPVPPPRPSVTNEARLSVSSEARTIPNRPPAPSIVAIEDDEKPETPRPRATAAEMAAAVRTSRAAFLARNKLALAESAATLEGGASTSAGRLRAFADFTRGDVGPALRALEQARDEARGGARVQAALALAVMLAGVGKADDALLEALDALARARELGDALAADACARFLRRLTAARLEPPSEPLLDELDVDIDLEDFDASP